MKGTKKKMKIEDRVDMLDSELDNAFGCIARLTKIVQNLTDEMIKLRVDFHGHHGIDEEWEPLFTRKED